MILRHFYAFMTWATKWELRFARELGVGWGEGNIARLCAERTEWESCYNRTFINW